MSDAIGYPDAASRRMITVSVLAATLMNSLDTTIANVALPHIQGSVSASSDQITWVLTSYLVAAAITTPLTGWLAGRYGRRLVMLVSILGFTAVSGLCGIATNLGEIVGFRVLQGIFGAALVPISQAILLDINPPERHGQAMAVWTMGAIMGPILGPVLGGWLTDNLTWRWVFYINVPIGALAFAGLTLFLSETKPEKGARLDLFGFATLGLAIGCLQLMLDRGQQQDWFSSTEIRLETGGMIFFFYLFVVQTMTVRKPFVDLALFADRNFLSCCLVGFLMGMLLFAVLSILPQLLEGLMGYPVVTTGLMMASRGTGTFVSTYTVSRITRFVDARLMILAGLAFNAIAMFMLSGASLQMGSTIVVTSGFVQGLGSGLVFTPLAALAFATLETRYRNEGAAMFTLIRSLGSSIGISTLQVLSYRSAAVVQSRLTEGLRPDNPLVQTMPTPFSLEDPFGMAVLGAEVRRQAAMVSYIDCFWLLGVITVVSMALVLLMRPPRRGARAVTVHMD